MSSVILRARESFWFFPAVLGILAIVVAEALVAVDRVLIDSGATQLFFLDALGATGGRSILTIIGSSMLTVAGTSFSITISVLATTSSTYGPRLVRNFMADRANQLVLAAFTSTFLYTIVVLRSVHTELEDTVAFVPVIAVHTAVVLGIVDVGVLVFFIHHIATSVQVTTLQKNVQSDLFEAIEFAYPKELRDGATTEPVPFVPMSAEADAADNGYVQSVSWKRLASIATSQNARFEAIAMPGDYIIEREVLVRSDVELTDDVTDDVRACFSLGVSRTPHQDVSFALQQLVEIGVRGLASGTNDPYTAVSALDLSARVLVPLWRDRRRITGYLGDDGAVLVSCTWPEPEVFISSMFDGVFTYGLEHPIVLDAALVLCRRLIAARPDDSAGFEAIEARLNAALSACAP